MPYLVYKITNKTNQKEYIGFHEVKDTIDDGYMGSGKLIKWAVEKYGVDNFHKEALAIFHKREDAEKYEGELVNIDYVMREDTYNLTIGGNVCILYGEQNGFYGKNHSKDTIDKIQETRTKTIKERGYARKTQYHCIINGEEKYSKADIKRHLYGIGEKISDDYIILFVTDDKNDCYFFDEEIYETFLIERQNILQRYEKNKKVQSDLASRLFKGKKKSEETRKRMSESAKGKKRENKHNKDPEKIRKMAEKHRGMKRSDEAKKNMSTAVNKFYEDGGQNPIKGKNGFHNPNNPYEFGFFMEGKQPDGWVNGMGYTKNYYFNPKTKQIKKFFEGDEPEGWLKGGKAKLRKFLEQQKESNNANLLEE